MEIKIAQPSDWLAYKEIRLESLKESPQAFGGIFENELKRSDGEWEEKLKDDGRIFVLANDLNKTVGITGARNVNESDWDIIAVYLAPELRGKGYSKKLLNFVLEELKIRGAKNVALTVNTEQESAIKLYKSMGFEIVDIAKDQMLGDGLLHDEYRMEKVV